MIILSNDRWFEFMIASGMMGFDCQGHSIAHKIMYELLRPVGLFDPKLFAFVTKTITLHPVKGPRRIKWIKDGIWNNWGLDNPGLNVFLEKHARKLKNRNNNIISIAGKEEIELKVIGTQILLHLPNILAIEYDVSCPNDQKVCSIGTKEIIKNCEFLKKNFEVPLILKIGKNNSYCEIVQYLEGVIDAVDINSVPADDGIGAISGYAAQTVNWQIMDDLIRCSSVPVIAPSIWFYDDIWQVFVTGAKAVSFGSVTIPRFSRPWAPILPTLWVKKWIKKYKGGQK